MVPGYAVAVIAGFLLTAVGNWTQRETLVGTPLLALSALWVLGRVAMAFAGALPRGLPALVDLAFLPALIAVLARPLLATRSRRNFIMLGILGALFAANVVVHLDALGVMAMGSARRACLVAIDVVVLIILLIADRVFPMFTRNTTGLIAGEVIGSGTVGRGCILEHDDGRWLAPGDEIELEIEGIGVLHNRIVGPA